MNYKYLYMRGRVGLSKILRGLGVGKGDKIALQAFTCIAVPEAIYSLGAIPVYIDLDKNSVNMSPESLEISLKTKAIKAVIIQHTFGIPARLDKLGSLCEDYNVHIIEDCCHTHNSTFNGNNVGQQSVASFFSFEWGKPIIAGMGGAVIINDKELDKFLTKDYEDMMEPNIFQNAKNLIQIIAFKILYRPVLYWYLKDIFHILSKYRITSGNYSHEEIGLDKKPSEDFLYKMPVVNKLQLYLGIKNHNKNINTNKRLGEYYYNEFTRDKIGSSMMFQVPDNCEVHYSRFPLMVSNKKLLLELARKKHIEISSFYDSPVHPQDPKGLESVGYELGSCPNAEALCGKIISLPINPNISTDYIKTTIQFIKSHEH
jgi:perosamine synthetase